MSVVARDRLVERVEQYVARNPDATLAAILGHFRLDPAEDSEERALVEEVLGRREERAPARDDIDAEPGGVKA